MPEIDSLVEKKASQVDATGTIITAIRLLNRGAVRWALRALTREVELNGERKPLMEWVLARYAGEKQCPIVAHMIAPFFEAGMKLATAYLHSDDEAVKKMLGDPAVRRGLVTTLRGIALFGVTTPQKLPAPFFIVWNFTNSCNLRCIHCYQNAGRPLPNELSLDEKLRVVKELDEAGVPAIALSGGEPTVHRDFWPVLAEIARRGFYPAIATNGLTLSNMEFAEKARRAGLRYVEISIDAADPRVHDKFRGVNGAWSKAVNGLRNAVKLGFSTALAFTVTKVNLDEVDKVIELAQEIGVSKVIFFNFVPVGRGRENLEIDLSPEEREEFLRHIYGEMKRTKMEIISTAPQYGRVVNQLSAGSDVSPTHFVVASDPITKELTEFIGGCGAGRVYAAIEPEGTLTPCVFLPHPVGNLRSKSFWDIWMDPFMENFRNRDLLKGFCGQCPYKLICGGCRARAYNYFGDVLAPDPGCIYNSSDWRKLMGDVSKIKVKAPMAIK
ncbi:heme biosynthesis protein [Thermocladium modestius]|uniref:Heme biosynthesis protein n=1 Tax=Thermocladium modestius TaxID=62609 RepID=A0A830GSS7_9CREN|nr:radical SAM protein [Thermocladium modestius]GGP19366.1 heme biosynthesis protein [Thermocladium modestius]